MGSVNDPPNAAAVANIQNTMGVNNIRIQGGKLALGVSLVPPHTQLDNLFIPYTEISPKYCLEQFLKPKTYKTEAQTCIMLN